jgi:hypothetical protein
VAPRVPGFRWSAEITEALRGPRAQGNGGQSGVTAFSAAELVAMPVGSSPSTRIKGSVSTLVDEKCSVRVWWRSDLPFESIHHPFSGLPEVPLHLVGPSGGFARVIACSIASCFVGLSSVTWATFSALSLLVTDFRFTNFRRKQIHSQAFPLFWSTVLARASIRRTRQRIANWLANFLRTNS